MDDELRLTNLGSADESILFERAGNGLIIEIEEPWADREGGNGVTASVLLTAERVAQLKGLAGRAGREGAGRWIAMIS